MNKISIKLRVTLWYTLVMVVISLIILTAMLSVSQNMMARDVTTRLAGTVMDSSRRFITPDGQVRQAPEFMFYERGVHLELFDASSVHIAGMIPLDREKLPDFEDKKLHTLTYEGQRYYLYDQEIKTHDGNTFWLRGAISTESEGYAMRSVMKTNLTLTVVLILVAAFGGYYILHHALKPVRKISATAKQISESSDLSRRIEIGGGKDEIHRLAETFDTMLDKIEKNVEREKQFTSDASHELRTPVAVIISECEYMLDCAKTVDECKESAVSVKRQAEKMSKLISELLAISRMDRGTQAVNFEMLDLSELLTFVCEEQREIHDDSVTLLHEIQPNVTAFADQFLIARLFINLIDNAYRYSNPGTQITVSLKEQKNTVCLTVADEGIGIPQEHLPKIWERFYQVDPARSHTESGSMGLGLSMVRQIAERHRGHVTVQSEPQKGSVFTFTMPKDRSRA